MSGYLEGIRGRASSLWVRFQRHDPLHVASLFTGSYLPYCAVREFFNTTRNTPLFSKIQVVFNRWYVWIGSPLCLSQLYRAYSYSRHPRAELYKTRLLIGKGNQFLNEIEKKTDEEKKTIDVPYSKWIGDLQQSYRRHCSDSQECDEIERLLVRFAGLALAQKRKDFFEQCAKHITNPNQLVVVADQCIALGEKEVAKKYLEKALADGDSNRKAWSTAKYIRYATRWHDVGEDREVTSYMEEAKNKLTNRENETSERYLKNVYRIVQFCREKISNPKLQEIGDELYKAAITDQKLQTIRGMNAPEKISCSVWVANLYINRMGEKQKAQEQLAEALREVQQEKNLITKGNYFCFLTEYAQAWPKDWKQIFDTYCQEVLDNRGKQSTEEKIEICSNIVRIISKQQLRTRRGACKQLQKNTDKKKCFQTVLNNSIDFLPCGSPAEIYAKYQAYNVCEDCFKEDDQSRESFVSGLHAFWDCIPMDQGAEHKYLVGELLMELTNQSQKNAFFQKHLQSLMWQNEGKDVFAVSDRLVAEAKKPTYSPDQKIEILQNAANRLNEISAWSFFMYPDTFKHHRAQINLAQCLLNPEKAEEGEKNWDNYRAKVLVISAVSIAILLRIPPHNNHWGSVRLLLAGMVSNLAQKIA